MPTFVYTALDPNGKTIKGKTEAESESLLLSKLHEQNYHVLSVNEEKTRAAKANNVPSAGKKVKLKNMVIFSRQFATMIDAGIAIVRCLDIL